MVAASLQLFPVRGTHRPVEVRCDDELELVAAAEVDHAAALHLEGLHIVGGHRVGAMSERQERICFIGRTSPAKWRRCWTHNNVEIERHRSAQQSADILLRRTNLHWLVDERLEELQADLAADDSDVRAKLNEVRDEAAVVGLSVAAGYGARTWSGALE